MARASSSGPARRLRTRARSARDRRAIGRLPIRSDPATASVSRPTASSRSPRTAAARPRARDELPRHTTAREPSTGRSASSVKANATISAVGSSPTTAAASMAMAIVTIQTLWWGSSATPARRSRSRAATACSTSPASAAARASAPVKPWFTGANDGDATVSAAARTISPARPWSQRIEQDLTGVVRQGIGIAHLQPEAEGGVGRHLGLVQAPGPDEDHHADDPGDVQHGIAGEGLGPLLELGPAAVGLRVLGEVLVDRQPGEADEGGQGLVGRRRHPHDLPGDGERSSSRIGSRSVWWWSERPSHSTAGSPRARAASSADRSGSRSSLA